MLSYVQNPLDHDQPTQLHRSCQILDAKGRRPLQEQAATAQTLLMACLSMQDRPDQGE